MGVDWDMLEGFGHSMAIPLVVVAVVLVLLVPQEFFF